MPSNKPRRLSVPVIAALLLFVVFTLAFVIAFAVWQPTALPAEPVSAEAYAERVAALLTNANAANAEAHLNTYGCVACHVAGAANNVAPSFTNIGDVAAERRPPMPAAAYLYESIVNPAIYLVEGYNNVMPQNFSQRMSDAELGDVIAYLLLQRATEAP